MSNRFADLSRKRKQDGRLSLDEYETPEAVTELLLKHVSFNGPIYEPCCGSGRIVRVLERAGHQVAGADIRHDGNDYLDKAHVFQGDIVTNPPYHNGMAEAFVAHAIAKSTGLVAMLLQSGFLFGVRRTRELLCEFTPAMIIAVPWRIRFHIGDTDEVIKSQAYNHVWVIWNRNSRPMTQSGSDFIFPSC